MHVHGVVILLAQLIYIWHNQSFPTRKIELSTVCGIERFKFEYQANENPLKNSAKLPYIGQTSTYPTMKKTSLPC